MTLTNKITSRISIILSILLTAWSFFFYSIIIEEINDETDDSLEDYSEFIISRFLAGENLPSEDNGSNNSYHIREVSQVLFETNTRISYSDEMIYIDSKKEAEPARVLRTVFLDADDQYYELTVAIPAIEKDDLKEIILIWIILLYIILLLTIIVVNLGVFYRSLQPLRTLLKWLDNYSVSKTTLPLKNETDIKEFRKLNDAILRSAERNNEIYEQQKHFIGHASHELQTPLAICLNGLEILLDDTELSEKQMSEIIKTKQTLDYIIKLNKTLLLLAKIENNQFPNTTTVNVNNLLKKLIETYIEVYSHRNINLTFNENTILQIQMNEELAAVLFNNLLKNAYVHSQPEGTIEVTIEQSAITISNTGQGEALDKNKIFNYFYQGTKKEGSTGLGLALVNSISKLFEMTVSYDYLDGKHQFVLNSPH